MTSPDWLVNDPQRPAKAAWTPRPMMEPLSALTSEDVSYFSRQYQLDRSVSEAFIMRVEGRYALPLYGPDHIRRGWQLRRPWDGAPMWQTMTYTPAIKADTYMDRPGSPHSHYWGDGFYDLDAGLARPLVLVEDPLSAIKLVGEGYDSVALLGTPVNPDMVRVAELASRANLWDRETILALDADATDKAFAFVRQYGSAFRNIRIAILEQDLKDTDRADFPEVLGA